MLTLTDKHINLMLNKYPRTYVKRSSENYGIYLGNGGKLTTIII